MKNPRITTLDDDGTGLDRGADTVSLKAGEVSTAGRSAFRVLLEKAAISGTDFFQRQIPERPALVGDWFREGDLGFIFAPRGVGKTWLAHLLVSCLTDGRELGDWAVPSPVRVCLLDGEMPPGDVQERLKLLRAEGERLTVLSHQFLFDIAGRGFQLGDPEQRAALLDFCVTERIAVLVIDNLSSVSNISENDNDEWPALGDWLLDFRRNGIAVVVVHHAGRNGQMRGASRREDPAFWIIRLDDSRQRTATTEGARFRVIFTKQRNARKWPAPSDWHVTTNESGELTVEIEPADNDALVIQCIRDGLDTCGDIAGELDLSKGTVSKIASRLVSNGQLRIEHRRYILN